MNKVDKFPKDFLFGASISAYQAEGGVQDGGKLLSVADLSTIKPGYADNSISSDFYHHYKTDIRLLGEMGAKTFRFSLAWPRIIPDGDGEINQEGINFYNSVLDELEKYGITPMATLFHYDLPLSLQLKYGGWKNRKTVDAFVRFCKVCFNSFGDRIKYYFTINEPDILFMYGGHGLDYTGKDDFVRDKLIINHHFAVAHAKVVNLCHQMVPNAKVGPVFGYVPVYPHSCNPEDTIAMMNISDYQNSFFQELFLNGRYMKNVLDYYCETSLPPIIEENDMELLCSAKSDIIALNYYKSDVACQCCESESKRDMAGNIDGQKGTITYPKVPGKYQLCANDCLERNDWDWEIDPVGIRYMLRSVYYRYWLPIVITENGLAAHEKCVDGTINDDYRIEYLSKHLEQCRKAIDDGVELIGYCCWSFIDLLSTGHGFEKRYGLVYINRDNENIKDLKRIPKQSYYWYKKYIKENTSED